MWTVTLKEFCLLTQGNCCLPVITWWYALAIKDIYSIGLSDRSVHLKFNCRNDFSLAPACRIIKDTIKPFSFFACVARLWSPGMFTHPVLNGRCRIKLLQACHVDVDIHVVPQSFRRKWWATSAFELIVQTFKICLVVLRYVKETIYTYWWVSQHQLSAVSWLICVQKIL